MKIFVTKPYLPPPEEYLKRVSEIFERDCLTNQGPELQELEINLVKYLGVKNLQYVTNGTIALQLAIKALNITGGEIITTPFSYVATVSSILWENCTPVFVDIESDNFTIDPEKIENAITNKTKAIMPVHVFGYACNVNKIEKIAKQYNLKVIYDAAHTFGARYKGRALCDYGDISTLSFHATKLFHTIEGGALITKDEKINRKLDLMKRFGHNGDNHYMLGINAKQDEFNAAMGNVNLQHIDSIITERMRLCKLYDTYLNGKIQRPKDQNDLDYNYAYYPILFKNESSLISTFERLNDNGIFPRRYFYPTLNKLPYINSITCEISEDISRRIACLPLFIGLTDELVRIICESI